ncbi:peptide ABC transporter substrate-binding protein [Microbacterium sp.]|uniref:peptide ABC transporter substrate-binding protein n=1 Tax=Microbacterium sp. TaxID=51671 RepID=UPI0039E34ABA
MKRNRIALAGLALLTAGTLALAGCAGGDAAEPTESPEGDAAAIVTTNGSEPENPLIPTNTNEAGGGKILEQIFAGLIYYDGDGKIVNEMADEIVIDDASHLTVTLKEGQTFSDGSPVTAESFTKAWNYGAQLSNAQLNQSWFADIEGFSADADSELTGLKVVDDLTFTIALTAPVAADFVTRLGYNAYAPLPESAFEDMAAFGEHPIGNGPYKLASDAAWEHGVKIELVKNEDYTGGREVVNGGLTIVFYSTLDAAYADLLAGNVDVIDAIPPSSLSAFQDDLGDRAVNQPAAIIQTFWIDMDMEHFTGEEGKLRRAAISKAINRPEITKTIFSDTRTPATDYTSPVLDGWSDSLEGADVLEYDPDEAKKLWAEADAISPWSGTFQIAVNTDGGHQEWAEAVCNSIKNTLGIEASPALYADFAAIRTAINDGSMKTAYRAGWQADYPGMYNFLQPIYGTGASSNTGGYSNPEFDALLASGAAAQDSADAIADYQKAQEILLQDLPQIPMWYSNVTGGYADTVSNVSFGWNSWPLYYEITKK